MGEKVSRKGAKKKYAKSEWHSTTWRSSFAPLLEIVFASQKFSTSQKKMLGFSRSNFS
jgi:hypothetical protein